MWNVRKQIETRWLEISKSIIISFVLGGVGSFLIVSDVVNACSADLILAYAMHIAVTGIAFYITPILLSKWYNKIFIATTAILYAIGWGIIDITSSVAGMYIGFGVIAGLAAGCLQGLAFSTAIEEFPGKACWATLALVISGAVGAVLLALGTTALAQDLIHSYIYRIFGSVSGLLILINVIFMDPIQTNTGSTTQKGINKFIYWAFGMVCIPTVLALVIGTILP